MTVIAYRDGIIAADRQATSYGLAYEVEKLFVSEDAIRTGTGDASFVMGMIEWHKAGADPKTFPESQKTDDWARLIVVTAEGVSWYERSPYPLRMKGEYMAWGSGADFAMGAMYAGASAEEAVLAAIKHNNSCGIGTSSAAIAKITEIK